MKIAGGQIWNNDNLKTSASECMLGNVYTADVTQPTCTNLHARGCKSWSSRGTMQFIAWSNVYLLTNRTFTCLTKIRSDCWNFARKKDFSHDAHVFSTPDAPLCLRFPFSPHVVTSTTCPTISRTTDGGSAGAAWPLTPSCQRPWPRLRLTRTLFPSPSTALAQTGPIQWTQVHTGTPRELSCMIGLKCGVTWTI